MVSTVSVSSVFIVYDDTSQYGTIIDTVTAKGGLNNYYHVLIAHAQGALLAFSGDQIKPVYTTFAKWLSVEHDRKGAHLGAIAYSNGTASSEFTVLTFFLGSVYDNFTLMSQYSAPVLKVVADDIKILRVVSSRVTGFNLRRRPGVTKKDKGALKLWCIRESDKSLGMYAYDSVRGLSAPIIKARIKGGQDWKDAAYCTYYVVYGTPLSWRGCI
ncbi:hypothetical protein EDB89DRAFT_1904863 [Lactarius sanguifluus]|nr:hypothetical protein EDB89DRAFT_1904863 [Lactarius sanguifluus]